MSDDNGAGGKLSGWVIAICGGRAFIGCHVERHVGGALFPVFDLQAGVALQQGPQGPVLSRPCMAAPVLGLASVLQIVYPKDAIIIPLEELSAADRAALSQAVDMGTQIQQQMRAAESGVLIAPAGTKLPPLVRG